MVCVEVMDGASFYSLLRSVTGSYFPQHQLKVGKVGMLNFNTMPGLETL